MRQETLQRKNWIDAAKAVAILVVVLNHSGLVIPGVNYWGGMFYVPAFFLLAGYTYMSKEESYGTFIKRKAKRLLAPYFTANGILFLFFLGKELVTGSFRLQRTLLSFAGILYGRTQLLKSEGSMVIFEAPMPNVGIMLNQNAPTWFLPALFLVLVCADGAFRLMKGSGKKVNLLVAVFACFMLVNYYLSPFIMPWCLDILPYLLVFFLIGYELKDKQVFEWLERQKTSLKCAFVLGLALVTAGTGLGNGSFNLSVSYFGKSVAVCLVCAAGSTVLLLLFLRCLDRKAAKITAWVGRLGKYNMSILCYHYFVMQMFFAFAEAVRPGILDGTGAVPALLRLAGIVVSLCVCVVGSMVCHKTVKRIVRKSGKGIKG